MGVLPVVNWGPALNGNGIQVLAVAHWLAQDPPLTLLP
jgi:hypothetical protein